MRRARLRYRYAAAAALPVAVLLAGCGIQETDVVEAGGPATIQTFVTHGDDMLLFFRAPDGELSPVIRTAYSESTGSTAGFPPGSASPDGEASPATTGKAVQALLAGPGKEDLAAGLGTGLPRVKPGGFLRLAPEQGGVSAGLPIALGGLDETAVRQLICTIAYAEDAEGGVKVRLTGQDISMAPATCGIDVHAGTAPTPSAGETDQAKAPPAASNGTEQP
ncbi:hypothetical protein ABZ532_24460 [Streptomyces sp. NPDC019396]|uniref:hypothetical protein n=1 Tax=Streptomyces sp. NPDC019396 TaxID=3154687 RepID=UPI0033F7406E